MEAQEEGWSVFWDGVYYPINKDGRLETWPEGLFDLSEKQLRKLVGW